MPQSSKKSHEPQTYFVTGAQGCIGAWVVKHLVDRGEKVTVFDKSTDHRRLNAIMSDDAVASVRFMHDDITDTDVVRRAVDESEATRIIHLAGLQVPFCKADPPLGAAVNVVGTVNVFEAAKTCGIDRVSYASSAAVYSVADDVERPTERDACEPATHYGVYKRANEGTAHIYFNDDGISSVGLRPLTVYGVGRDQGLTSGPTRAMKAAVVGRPFTILFGGATDFQYVGDTAATFIAAADGGPAGAHVFNLEGDCVAIDDIVSRIETMMPAAKGTIHVDGDPIPIPPSLDGSAIRDAYPDLPRTSIDDGMTATITRFRELLADDRLDRHDLED